MLPPSRTATRRRTAGGRRQVRAMFDRIAGVYDPMNTAMTAGLHHRWRARAAELARVGPGSRVLDVATGTGDLAIELARRVSPGGEVVGCDFAEGMLARARAKARRARTARVRPRFEWADALELPYAEDRFDAATVGFGARNFADLRRGLAEMARVVRPGGRVVVLEITTPTRAAAVALLRAVVRPDRAGARPPGGRARGADRRRRRRVLAAPRSPTPTPTCPTPSSASRARRARRRDGARGPVRRSAICSRPAASSRSTPAPFRRSAS